MTWQAAAAFAALLAFWALVAVEVRRPGSSDVLAPPARRTQPDPFADLRRAFLEMQRAFGEALLPVLARWAEAWATLAKALPTPSGPAPPRDPYGDHRARQLLALYHAGRISWDELEHEQARALDRPNGP